MRKQRILPGEAASALGSIKTAKKAASSAANGRKRGLMPLDALSCVCGQCPDNPKTYCPRGRAILRRRSKMDQSPETISFEALAANKRAKLRALMKAPEAEREAVLDAGASLAEVHFATPAGAAELSDWRALQSESFHD